MLCGENEVLLDCKEKQLLVFALHEHKKRVARHRIENFDNLFPNVNRWTLASTVQPHHRALQRFEHEIVHILVNLAIVQHDKSQ